MVFDLWQEAGKGQDERETRASATPRNRQTLQRIAARFHELGSNDDRMEDGNMENQKLERTEEKDGMKGSEVQEGQKG